MIHHTKEVEEQRVLEAATFFFSYAQQMIPKTFYSSDENISFQNTQEHTVKFLLSDTFIRNAAFASQK